MQKLASFLILFLVGCGDSKPIELDLPSQSIHENLPKFPDVNTNPENIHEVNTKVYLEGPLSNLKIPYFELRKDTQLNFQSQQKLREKELGSGIINEEFNNDGTDKNSPDGQPGPRIQDYSAVILYAEGYDGFYYSFYERWMRLDFLSGTDRQWKTEAPQHCTGWVHLTDNEQNQLQNICKSIQLCKRRKSWAKIDPLRRHLSYNILDPKTMHISRGQYSHLFNAFDGDGKEIFRRDLSHRALPDPTYGVQEYSHPTLCGERQAFLDFFQSKIEPKIQASCPKSYKDLFKIDPKENVNELYDSTQPLLENGENITFFDKMHPIYQFRGELMVHDWTGAFLDFHGLR